MSSGQDSTGSTSPSHGSDPAYSHDRRPVSVESMLVHLEYLEPVCFFLALCGESAGNEWLLKKGTPLCHGQT
jgi:hypothetical protein